MMKKRILFVCHGNICRSPMAEFIMKHLVAQAGKASDFEKTRESIRYLIKYPYLLCLKFLFFRDMAQRERDNDPVSDKIPEAVEIILYLCFRGVCPMLFIVIVDVFQNIAVELLFGTDQ